MEDFFDFASDPSKVKFKIVGKYFWAWAKIMSNRVNGNIAYVDLFSGQGKYKDGTKSIPILVLESTLRDQLIKNKLVTLFNDINPNNTTALTKSINEIVDIDLLKHKPIILNQEVDKSFHLIFEKQQLMPTLFFVDPWGYKGLSLELISSVLKDWGCDCIFFFNYNRINACLSNPILNTNTNSIFGNEIAEMLKNSVKALKGKPKQREELILNALKNSLKKIGGEYYLNFKFFDNTGKKTSHFIIFVSKNVLAYSIMKEIMGKESSYFYDNEIPSFLYTPIDTKNCDTLFTPSLSNLEESILEEFSKRRIKMKDIYRIHHINKPFLKKNYKTVLLKLERENKIQAIPNKRRKDSMGDEVEIIFP